MVKSKIILNGLDPNHVFYHINRYLIQLFNKFPEMFYDDIQLWGIYGSFSAQKHASHEINGNHHRTNLHNISDVAEVMKVTNMHVILDAGSDMIKESSIYDYYDGCIYDTFNYNTNYVSTDSKLIRDYINREFPHYKVLPSYYSHMSQERCFDNINCGIMTFVQPDFDYDALCECDTNYAIMIINPWCKAHCSKYYAHLREDQSVLSNYKNELELRTDTKSLPNKWVPRQMCPNCNSSINAVTNDKKFLNHDAIRMYADIGVQYFMFENFIFQSVYNVIETYCKTLVRPEAADQFRFLIGQSLEGGSK